MGDDHGPPPDGATGRTPRPSRSYRARLGQAYVRELQKDFEQGGQDVLAKLREQAPLEYLKMVSALLPEEMGRAEEKPKTSRLRRTVVRHRD